ncbi:Uma2 family endonuclease [Scytonema millei]|uniref:Uma2 family endonuclease n=1 Tax=Scytonema millei VB511283 TaxID=1245923 RepID=A0A9X5E7P9_9CYAN|nr:Uma2 family endonuclease [Scytonema millei]NHC36905.1 Uma2 family endonuclease [Scytonema millei VB511283]
MNAIQTTRLFTVDEYRQMAECGILKPEERTELIDGQIILMAAQRPPHAAVSDNIEKYFRVLFEGVAAVRSQKPIVLSDRTEPEPDLALARIDARNYYDRHPLPSDLFLIVEVSDTTLMFDTNQKLAAYARSGLSDYWVVDVNAQVVRVFRRPQNSEYLQQFSVEPGDTLTVLVFPEIQIEIGNFFPE